MTDLQVPSILVVDDNEMNRDVLARRLERQNYRVTMAEDGQVAVDLLSAAPTTFDLVLLDIMMPRMNGFQVLEFMKDQPSLRQLPVIIISAIDELDSVVRCVELGAEDYLFKPFNPILLKARIHSCLEKKRLADRTAGANRGELDSAILAKLDMLERSLSAGAVENAQLLVADIRALIQHT
jgi:adenylate cyclase